MLKELSIRDIVLVDRMTVRFGDGLSAVTGETGAGKSVLLDAIGLAVGAKGNKGLVRHGAAEGVVVASFDVAPDHPVFALLQEHGVRVSDDMLTLRRIQSVDGRSRGFVNDEPCSVAFLKKIGSTLIEIHGQHDSVCVLESATHRELLDTYGCHGALLEKTSAAWSMLTEAESALDKHRTLREAAMREEGYLRHVLEELEALSPVVGEEHQLAERRAELMAAEKVAADLEAAISALEDDAHARRLASTAVQLERAASRLAADGAGPLSEAVARLDTAIDELHAARDATVSAAALFVPDQDELEATEQRLFALRAAGRKYGQSPDQLVAYQNEVKGQLRNLDQASEAEAALSKAVVAAQAAFDRATKYLTKARRRSAERLASAVTGELHPLKLERAKFGVTVGGGTMPGPFGVDSVVFELSANPGSPMAPLGEVASGGELSRIVLALKSVLAAAQQRTVIVFDEVDSGVGGAVADAVGERMARIAHGSQVLVVTHSPQVAARAAQHFRVEKSGRRSIKTSLIELDVEERIEELARMVSGATVTDAARQTARILLADACDSAAHRSFCGSPQQKTRAKTAA